jgi:DNA-binding transcriptional MocR family regulator
MSLIFDLDRRSVQTLVDQIVDAVTLAIDQNYLRVGDALPSIRVLAVAHRVSTFTVAEAYQRLVSTGRLNARRGSGYRVSDPHIIQPSTLPVWTPPSLNAAWLLSDVFADYSVPIKAGCGWIPGEWINESGLQYSFRASSRLPGARFGGYGHPYGMTTLREQIASSLHRFSVPVDTSNILLTQGATQALDLVVRTLLRPGDTVIVEDPCYCNLLQILQLAGLTVIGVTRSSEGLDIEQLEFVLKHNKVKAIFVNTVLQNPTGTSLSMINARRLLAITALFDLWIIEDDIYRELAPPEAPCLAGLEGLSRVIYISGFSKTIAPTLRVGYVVAHQGVLADLARTKMAVGLTSSLVTERIVSHIVREGNYERHITFLKEKLHAAHANMVVKVKLLDLETFEQPEAGLFLWVKLPIVADQSINIANRALKHGIWLAPGSFFRPGALISNWFRFNVASSDNEILWSFIRSLLTHSRSMSFKH